MSGHFTQILLHTFIVFLKPNGLKENELLKPNGLNENDLKPNGLNENDLKTNGLIENDLKPNGLNHFCCDLIFSADFFDEHKEVTEWQIG